MAEPLYGLTRAAAKLVGEMAARHRQRLPDTGQRRRRVSAIHGGAGSGPVRMSSTANLWKFDVDGKLKWTSGGLGSANTSVSKHGTQLWYSHAATSVPALIRVDAETGAYVQMSQDDASGGYRRMVAFSGGVFGLRAGDKVYKRLDNFTTAWSATIIGSTGIGLAYDATNDKLYGPRQGGGGFRSWDSAGATDDDVSYTGTPNGIAVDSSANVYTANANGSSVSTRKHNAAGSEQWNHTHGADLNAIALDEANSRLFIGGAGASNVPVRCLDPSTGSVTWSLTFTGWTCLDLAIDSLGDLYASGTAAQYDSGDRMLVGNVFKINPSTGAITGAYWCGNGVSAYDLFIDSDDSLYVTAQSTGSLNVDRNDL